MKKLPNAKKGITKAVGKAKSAKDDLELEDPENPQEIIKKNKKKKVVHD